MEFYGYLGLGGKAPSLTSSFLAFPSQDLPGANVLSIFFTFYRGKPLQNRSAPHFIEGLPSCPITGAHAFLFYRGNPLQNRSAPHFIEGLSSCPITGAHAFLFYRGNPLQNRSAPHFIEGLPSCPITGAHAFLFYRGNPLQNRSAPHFIEGLPSCPITGAHAFLFYRGNPLQNRSAPHFIEGFPSCPITGAHAFLFYRGNPLQNRSAPHFIEGLPSCPITGAHAFLFYRGNPLQNRSVPHFIERLSEFFLFLKQYIQIVFKIFNALGCVARFHPGLGDFSPLITSIKKKFQINNSLLWPEFGPSTSHLGPWSSFYRRSKWTQAAASDKKATISTILYNRLNKEKTPGRCCQSGYLLPWWLWCTIGGLGTLRKCYVNSPVARTLVLDSKYIQTENTTHTHKQKKKRRFTWMILKYLECVWHFVGPYGAAWTASCSCWNNPSCGLYKMGM